MLIRFRDWPLLLKLIVSPALIVVVVLLAFYGAQEVIEQKEQEHTYRVDALDDRERILVQLRSSVVEVDLVLFRTIMARIQNAPETERNWLRDDAFRRLSNVERQAGLQSSRKFLLPQEEPYLRSIEAAVMDYAASGRDVLRNIPKHYEPDDRPLDDVSAHFVAVEASITAWGAYKTAAYNHLKRSSDEEMAQTMFVFSLFAGLVVCGAFILTIVVSRLISTPIQNVVEVMGNLANGDHNVPVIAVNRKDEVGTMMVSIAAFQAKLQALNEKAEYHNSMQLQAQLDLKRQVEKLAASEQRLRDIAESASDWFWEADAEDRMTTVSQRFYDVTGLAPKQVIGTRRLDYAKPARTQEDATEWVTYAKKVSEHQSFKDLDYRIQGADGREVCIRSSGTPFFDKDHKFKGYRGASTDITKLVRTQEELENNRNHLLGISSNLFEGVILVAMDGEVLFANPSAHRLLQVAEGSLQGQHMDQVLHVIIQGVDASYLKGPMHRAFAVRDTIVDENAKFRLVASQETLSVAYACAVIAEGGDIPSVVVSFRSIEALKHAQREALQSSRLASVGQLAAGIAHEINTPIQYVGDNIRFFDSSFATLNSLLKDIQRIVKDSQAPEDFREKINNALEEADAEYLLEELPEAAQQSLDGVEHVAKIVRSMKEFSHPGGGAAKVMTDINRTIESTLVVSTNEWKHNAIIEKDLSDELPQILCLPAEINQVLLNIIVNASHALEGQKQKGLIKISTRRDGESVEIRIADNGPGIPDEIREHVFDPFFTTKSVGKGTGQGLAISMDVIVSKHDGELMLEDTPGGGATFVIQLPIGDAKAAKSTKDTGQDQRNAS